MKLWTLPSVVMAAMLAGCATTAEVSQITDTYCMSVRKVRWSTSDSAETIRQIEVHNKTWDLRCGPGKVKP